MHGRLKMNIPLQTAIRSLTLVVDGVENDVTVRTQMEINVEKKHKSSSCLTCTVSRLTFYWFMIYFYFINASVIVIKTLIY